MKVAKEWNIEIDPKYAKTLVKWWFEIYSKEWTAEEAIECLKYLKHFENQKINENKTFKEFNYFKTVLKKLEDGASSRTSKF